MLPFVVTAHAVIDEAFRQGAETMAPLLSGGHDSMAAVYLASQHRRFDGTVHHMRTGIGAKATWEFVQDVARDYGWTLRAWKSASTYEMFVRERGFPGPGMHQWAYVRLKERCLRQIMASYGKTNVALVTGCRIQESDRRMGNVEPIKIGEREWDKKKQAFKTVNKRRYWIAPCHDWSTENQTAFMDSYDLPRNPIKQTPLGMSGECFCGAFARPNEIALIRRYAPDVAEEIDRLTIIAQECGKHAVWGTRPPGKRNKGILVAKTGPLCNSCDIRATASGIIIDQKERL